MLQYTIKPIVQWPGDLTPNHKRQHSRFDSVWGRTLELLEQPGRVTKLLHPDNQETGDEKAFVDLQDAIAVLLTVNRERE